MHVVANLFTTMHVSIYVNSIVYRLIYSSNCIPTHNIQTACIQTTCSVHVYAVISPPTYTQYSKLFALLRILPTQQPKMTTPLSHNYEVSNQPRPHAHFTELYACVYRRLVSDVLLSPSQQTSALPLTLTKPWHIMHTTSPKLFAQNLSYLTRYFWENTRVT